MTLIEAIIFGLVQGVTEFIPISSSGHLSLLGRIFNTDPDAMFTLSAWVHMGSLMSVFIVMRREIMEILRDILGPRTWKIMIATIPTVIVAFLIHSRLSDIFGGHFLGYSFLITGVFLMMIVLFGRGDDKKMAARTNSEAEQAKTADTAQTAIKSETKVGQEKQHKPGADERNMPDDKNAAEKEKNTSIGIDGKEVGYLEAILAGIGQAIAILPGVSRSGSTLTALLIAKVDRKKAIRFSFLMSIPAILGGFVFDLRDLIAGEGAALETLGLGKLLVGVLASFIAGWLAMEWMLRKLKGKAFMICAVYVLVLGILVLIDQTFTQLVFN